MSGCRYSYTCTCSPHAYFISHNPSNYYFTDTHLKKRPSTSPWVPKRFVPILQTTHTCEPTYISYPNHTNTHARTHTHHTHKLTPLIPKIGTGHAGTRQGYVVRGKNFDSCEYLTLRRAWYHGIVMQHFVLQFAVTTHTTSPCSHKSFDTYNSNLFLLCQLAIIWFILTNIMRYISTDHCFSSGQGEKATPPHGWQNHYCMEW